MESQSGGRVDDIGWNWSHVFGKLFANAAGATRCNFRRSSFTCLRIYPVDYSPFSLIDQTPSALCVFVRQVGDIVSDALTLRRSDGAPHRRSLGEVLATFELFPFDIDYHAAHHILPSRTPRAPSPRAGSAALTMC
jgi:hypothetical protein